jgi:hypothetical protein
MFPLQANHLQHLYLILRNDVDCNEAKQNKNKITDGVEKTCEQLRNFHVGPLNEILTPIYKTKF